MKRSTRSLAVRTAPRKAVLIRRLFFFLVLARGLGYVWLRRGLASPMAGEKYSKYSEVKPTGSPEEL